MQDVPRKPTTIGVSTDYEEEEQSLKLPNFEIIRALNSCVTMEKLPDCQCPKV